jgi:predicted methyltransferase
LNRHRPLTKLAHELLADKLQPGDKAVDATAGNGYDAVFLARAIAPGGHLYAFDVQRQALLSTTERLQKAGLLDYATLCESGHEHMLGLVPSDWQGHVAVVTFNLGYLPGSNKQTTTRSSSTLPALDQSIQLLRPGGALSVLAYRGHPGGEEEAGNVEAWIARQPTLKLQIHKSPGPVLYHCVKRSG